MVSGPSKRTQFSSCDACRQARVGCDASRVGYQPGGMTWSGSCSRCLARQCPCTFTVLYLNRPRRYTCLPGGPLTRPQWVNTNKRKTSQGRRHASRRASHHPIHPAPFLVWEPETHGHGTGVISDSPLAVVNDDDSRTSSLTNNTILEPSDELFCLGHPDPVDAQIRTWCDRIFQAGFGTLFGLWVGKHGCPMV